jgi:dipeptidyl aminopeptidase/acylaminoacyl peptidase
MKGDAVRYGPEDDVVTRRITHLAASPGGDAFVYAVDEADLLRNTRSTRLWRQSTDAAKARSSPLTTGHGAQRFPLFSPDGRSIAFVAGGPNGDRLLVVDAAGGRPREVLPSDLALVPSEIFNRGGAASLAWSPDSRSLACLTRTGVAVPGDLSVEGPRLTGDPLATDEITERLRGGPPVRLCVVNLDDGEVRFIGDAERPLGALSFAPDGRAVFAVSRSEGSTGGETLFSLLRFGLDGGVATVVTTFAGASFVPSLSPDGQWFAVAAARGTSHAPSPCLLLLASDGSTTRELSTDDLTTFSDIHWQRDGSSIVAVADAGVERRILRIDVSSGEPKMLPSGGGWIEMMRASADGETVIFVQSSLDDPGDVWVLDPNSDTPRRVTDVNPHLSSFELAHGERYVWHANDGTALEGVILYPPGHQAGQKAPFIIDYHGGPASHVTLGWNGQRQVFAGAGYVVFAPNFRGSTGYGAAFSEALRGDIGGVPYTDSIEGVDQIIADGSIDPERMFAYGHSWGGYMTNWTATQTNRFKAIVSSGSICNLLSVYHTRYSADVWRWRLLGTPSESLEQYLKWSPLLRADDVSVPVLFLNGAEDRTTPPTQGLEMFTALRQRNIRSEHVIFPREGHPTTEPHHQVDRVNRILRWFEQEGA